MDAEFSTKVGQFPVFSWNLPKENIFAVEMKIRFTYLLFLVVFSSLLSSCVEKAKPATYQVVRVYTDFPETFDKNSFRDFGRKQHIQVLLYHRTTETIIKQINEKKWQSGIDIVIMKNAMDLERLRGIGAIGAPKNDTLFYQPILIDPYVFHFQFDTVPLFSSFGQLFRNDRVKIDPSALRDKKEWGNLVGGLLQKYPKIGAQGIYNKVLRTDSLRGRDVKQLQIVPYSSIERSKKITFPDQYYKGTVGKISGMAVMKQAKYSTNALLLYEYCRQNWWREKLAEKVELFPYLDYTDEDVNKTLLYQGVIKDWRFIKIVKPY